MAAYAFALLVLGWACWMLPFILLKKPGAPAKVDRRARWGIMLASLGYACVYFGPFWMRRVAGWRIPLSVLFLLLGCLLSWTGTRTLGRHWRIDAGLNADHELIRSGPYRIVRHPIYASMLAMFLASGLMISTWVQFAIGLVLFLAGTEIRIRVEDALLASRFSDEFREYQRSRAAYIPFVR